MLRFIHAADIHLDSPAVGLARYGGAPTDAVKTACRRALSNLVDLALEQRVDFVLIAGDLFDGDWKDYNTGLYFAGRMSRLREAGIRVFIVQGNHDARGKMPRSLRLPENVTLFGTDRPRTVELKDLDVAVHGWSFGEGAEARNAAVEYPEHLSGLFNVGLLHTSLGGDARHDVYAPCSVDDLAAKNYDYWALGHVHQRRTPSREPWIVYSGNIQGRHARETGPKGCSLVGFDGKTVTVEHRDLDVLRWLDLTVDAADAPSAEAAVECVRLTIEAEAERKDGRSLAVRLTLACGEKARRDVDRDRERWINEIRRAAADAGRDEVWLEKVKFAQLRTPDDAARDDGFLGGILEGLADLSLDDPEIAAIFEAQSADLKAKVNPLFTRRGRGLGLDDKAVARELLENAREILKAALAERAGGR